MTACESSGYTGASFSITTVFPIRHIIHRFLDVVVADVSKLINNILFLADVKMISSPRQQKLVPALSEGLTRPKKKAPSQSFFSP